MHYCTRYAKRGVLGTKSFSSAFSDILQPKHIAFIADERELLTRINATLSSIDSSNPDILILKDVVSNLDDIFMLVVVGEFNAGKSSLINCMLGSPYLKIGALPTTSKVCILRSDVSTKSVAYAKRTFDLDEVSLPVPWLQHIAIVDTPGTNAIIAQHEKLTQQIIPRADMIVFVTSAERPLTESESNFLKSINQWEKRIILVVNKIDILNKDDQQMVINYVLQNAAAILGTTATMPIFGLSSRAGLAAKQEKKDPADLKQSDVWKASNFATFENYLMSSLSDDELLQAKFMNPLVSGYRVLQKQRTHLEKRHLLLDVDVNIVRFIDENIQKFMIDLNRDVQYYNQQIDLVMQNSVKHAKDFFEDKLSMMKPHLLLDNEALKKEFADEVFVDIQRSVDGILDDVSGLIEQRAKAQAESVMVYIGSRHKIHEKDMMGQVKDAQFHKSRELLLEKLHRDSKTILQVYNKQAEAEKFGAAVKNTLQQLVSVQAISTASVGALIAAHMIDVTGVLALSGFLVSSLLLIPYKKKQLM